MILSSKCWRVQLFHSFLGTSYWKLSPCHLLHGPPTSYLWILQKRSGGSWEKTCNFLPSLLHYAKVNTAHKACKHSGWIAIIHWPKNSWNLRLANSPNPIPIIPVTSRHRHYNSSKYWYNRSTGQFNDINLILVAIVPHHPFVTIMSTMKWWRQSDWKLQRPIPWTPVTSPP